jgi:hypothetical protein
MMVIQVINLKIYYFAPFTKLYNEGLTDLYEANLSEEFRDGDNGMSLMTSGWSS